MFTVRIYDYHPVRPGALLEEHDYMSEAEAREFASATVRDGGVRVTLNGAELGQYVITASVHDWAWTYSGISAEDAQGIADTLTTGSGETWTIEPLAS